VENFPANPPSPSLVGSCSYRKSTWRIHPAKRKDMENYSHVKSPLLQKDSLETPIQGNFSPVDHLQN